MVSPSIQTTVMNNESDGAETISLINDLQPPLGNMVSPSIQTTVMMDESDGAETIIRTFMMEQEQRRVHSARRSSVVDQIFRGGGPGQQLGDEPHSEVGRLLADYATQLDDSYYARETEQSISVLEQRPESRMLNLQRIINGVFRHGITAGHVMSLLQFGYRYVHHVIQSGIENGEEICRQILDSIIQYVKQYVVNWVTSIGGWNGFLEEVKVFVMAQAAWWHRHRMQLAFAALTVLTAVNVGALVYRYYK